MAIARITKRSVEAAEPAERDFFLVDPDLGGFRVRVRPSGRRTYEVRYVVGGRRRLFVIGEHGAPWTADEARRRAAAVLRDAAAGVDALEEKSALRRAETVADLVAIYLREGPIAKPGKRLSSWRTDRSNLEAHVLPLLGRMRAADLTPQIIARWRADVVSGKTARRVKIGPRAVSNVRGGEGTARRSLRTLSALLEWARVGGILTDNAAARVPRTPDGRREEFLGKDEALAFWTLLETMEAKGELRADFADFYRLLALTGARSGEIRTLLWSEVDLDRKLIRRAAERHKTGGRGQGRTIQLDDASAGILRVRKAAAGPDALFVFPKKDGAGPIAPPRREWLRIAARFGMPRLRPHDLRHTYASIAIAEGATLAYIGKALGHRSAATTERYAKLKDEAARRVADQVGAVYSLARLKTPDALH